MTKIQEINDIKEYVISYIKEWGYCFKPFILSNFSYKLRCDKNKSFQLEYLNTSMGRFKSFYFDNLNDVFNKIKELEGVDINGKLWFKQ